MKVTASARGLTRVLVERYWGKMRMLATYWKVTGKLSGVSLGAKEHVWAFLGHFGIAEGIMPTAAF